MADSPRTEARTKVLVETDDPDTAIATAKALEEVGFEATVCLGPGHNPDRCMLLHDGECVLVEDADVLLYDLDPDDDTQRAVLEGLRTTYPRLPIVAQIPTGGQRRHPAELEGVRVITPYSMDHVTGAVIEAAGATVEG